MNKPLSVSRKADRIFMATALAALVHDCGASCKINPLGSYPGDREKKVVIDTPAGLQLTVSFDGDSRQPDVYVLSWHMDWKAVDLLNNATFGGDVNPHHHSKATYVAHGFEDLCKQLRRGLVMAIDRTAFLPRKPALALALA